MKQIFKRRSARRLFPSIRHAALFQQSDIHRQKHFRRLRKIRCQRVRRGLNHRLNFFAIPLPLRCRACRKPHKPPADIRIIGFKAVCRSHCLENHIFQMIAHLWIGQRVQQHAARFRRIQRNHLHERQHRRVGSADNGAKRPRAQPAQFMHIIL